MKQIIKLMMFSIFLLLFVVQQSYAIGNSNSFLLDGNKEELLTVEDTSDLRNDTAFFRDQFTKSKNWLEKSGIPISVLLLDTFQIEKSMLTLNFKLKDKNHWHQLEILSDSLNRKSIEKFLFRKFLFQFELKKPQLKLELEGNDVFIIIYSQDNKVNTFVLDKMGEGISDNYIIPIEKIEGDHSENVLSNSNDYESIKNELKKHFKLYFENYDDWFEDFSYEIISDLDDELVIEIKNIKGAILEEKYFEYVQIVFEFSKPENQIVLDYTIMGKYGSGILWAPKSKDYYDMDPEYSVDLNRFSKKFKTQLNELFN